MKLKDFQVYSAGLKLAGKVLEPEDYSEQIAVLILHGIPRAKPEPGDPGYLPFAHRLCSLGFLTIFFNFRGTGESEGNFHILGWAEDLKAVINWLEQEYAPRGIVLVGFSGGGSVAIYHTAQDPRINALVSISSPANFSALGVDRIPELLIKNFKEIGIIRQPDFPPDLSRWLKEFEEIAPIKWIDKVSPRPLLIIHGEKDELVPKNQAEVLFNKAKEPKELYWIKDGVHRLRTDPRVWEKIKNWLLNWRENFLQKA